MIAIARLNRPAVFVYGGTILPGITKARMLILSLFLRQWVNRQRNNYTG
ncbi:MAG: hypothetical protein Ct9H300mP28_24330 [Pseudomonadota bacterium]|nr:MAG: hypothetical protein Ct9H300mP28_24330 [Pseudomonadota bacterium]